MPGVSFIRGGGGLGVVGYGAEEVEKHFGDSWAREDLESGFETGIDLGAPKDELLGRTAKEGEV